jgi:hypothetical protein
MNPMSVWRSSWVAGILSGVILGAATPARGTTIAKSGEEHSFSGVLHVETVPSGADVYVSDKKNQRGEYVGKTPVEKWLLPFTFWITVEYPGRTSVERRMVIRARDMNSLVVTLDYKMNPYKRFGHIAFWPGVAATLFGAGAAVPMALSADRFDADGLPKDQRTKRLWLGMMCAGLGSGALLMTTGLVLWMLSPGDKAYFDEKYGVAVVNPGTSGVTLGYSKNF